MYIILNRTLINVGDHLYYQNALKIIKKFKSEVEIREIDAWNPILEQINMDTLTKAKALVIIGGPCIREDLYSRLYPIPSEVFENKIPVIFLGVGSKFYPGNIERSRDVKLSKSSTKLLNHSIKCGYPIGVRDNLTKRVLLENHIREVQINGCPAWYDLNCLGKKLEIPTKLETIIFSAPNNPFHFDQAKQILKKIKKTFPSSKIIVTFHHGIKHNVNISKFMTPFLYDFAIYSKGLGCQILDISLDEKKLEKLKQAQIHLGYRVHGHIFFLSQRKPSFLISEDSRGIGTLSILGGIGTSAWSNLVRFLVDKKRIWRIINILSGLKSIGFIVRKFLYKRVAKTIVKGIKDELKNGFNSYKHIPQKIDDYFEKRMKLFVKSFP